MVRYKQPIKLEKPVCCSIHERNIVQPVLRHFISALQSDYNTNTVYVIGNKYVLGPSQSSSTHLAAKVKIVRSVVGNHERIESKSSITIHVVIRNGINCDWIE